MDKSSLLELLQVSGKTNTSEKDGSWVGSCDSKTPPPFGRTNFAGVKAFNQKILEERFMENTRKGNKKRRKSVKRSTTYSPLQDYQKHLAQRHSSALAKAFAKGTGSMLPGCTIGEHTSN